jgi:hypothetical protein
MTDNDPRAPFEEDCKVMKRFLSQSTDAIQHRPVESFPSRNMPQLEASEGL